MADAEYTKNIPTNLEVIENIQGEQPQQLKYIGIIYDEASFSINFSVGTSDSLRIDFNRVISFDFKPISNNQSLELGVIYKIQSEKAADYNTKADLHKKWLKDNGVGWVDEYDYKDRFGAIANLKHYLLPISNNNCIELLATDYSTANRTNSAQDYLTSYSKYRK